MSTANDIRSETEVITTKTGNIATALEELETFVDLFGNILSRSKDSELNGAITAIRDAIEEIDNRASAIDDFADEVDGIENDLAKAQAELEKAAEKAA